MKIDRHNYEEYFLLYIDNELTVEQKKQVELFVKENPDLEEELVMLHQLKLIPDKTIVFDKKDLLMKEENNSFINLNNYEEWLVLCTDSELNEKDQKEVEKFAAAHPHVQQELNLFQQTKLQSEKIVFADKEVLYKKERVTVISMLWWRVGVAAILIIAAGISLYTIVNKINNNRKTLIDIVIKKQTTPNSIKTTLPDIQEQTRPGIKKEKEQMAVTDPINKKSDKGNKQQGQKIQEEQKANQQLTNNNENRINQHVISEINDIKTIQPKISNVAAISDKMLKEKINEQSVTAGTTKTPNIPEEYATENKKLRGFFRKATRLIERTTNINPANDDNKVLIGGMAFNLK